MYTLDADGKRIYTLKKLTESGQITESAHPARFSPDDKYSRQRVTLKKRFGLLPTQNQGDLVDEKIVGILKRQDEYERMALDEEIEIGEKNRRGHHDKEWKLYKNGSLYFLCFHRVMIITMYIRYFWKD